MNTNGEVRAGVVPVHEIHDNTSQTLIATTEDKLRLALVEHLTCLEQKKRWHVPLGILMGMVPVFVTSEFNDFAGVSKETWHAFFMLSIFIVAGWLLNSLRNSRTTISLETLLNRIKTGRR